MKFTKEGAIKDLKTIKQAFDKCGIEFFLAYGTCLGIYRDKDFLEGDDDIDLGVVQPLSLEKRKEIGWLLDDLGFVPQQLTFNVFNHMEATERGYNGTEKTGIIVVERNVNITIFFYYDDGEQMVCAPRIGMKPLIASPSKFYTQLGNIEFRGDKYLTPNPIEGYLTYSYLDWENPTMRDHSPLYGTKR